MEQQELKELESPIKGNTCETTQEALKSDVAQRIFQIIAPQAGCSLQQFLNKEHYTINELKFITSFFYDKKWEEKYNKALERIQLKDDKGNILSNQEQLKLKEDIFSMEKLREEIHSIGSIPLSGVIGATYDELGNMKNGIIKGKDGLDYPFHRNHKTGEFTRVVEELLGEGEKYLGGKDWIRNKNGNFIGGNLKKEDSKWLPFGINEEGKLEILKIEDQDYKETKNVVRDSNGKILYGEALCSKEGEIGNYPFWLEEDGKYRSLSVKSPWIIDSFERNKDGVVIFCKVMDIRGRGKKNYSLYRTENREYKEGGRVKQTGNFLLERILNPVNKAFTEWVDGE